jgi:hypothetical protein
MEISAGWYSALIKSIATWSKLGRKHVVHIPDNPKTLTEREVPLAIISDEEVSSEMGIGNFVFADWAAT